MPDIKTVMGTFIALGEAAESVQLAQGIELRVATGQELVSISLMADIPDNFIHGSIENPVQSNRQLDDTERTGQMSTVLSHGRDNNVPQFFGQFGQICFRKGL